MNPTYPYIDPGTGGKITGMIAAAGVPTPGGTKSLSETEISSNQEVLCPRLP